MTGCEPEVYAAVSREMMDCFSESAESAFGLALSGDEGTASAMGTTLSWNYDAAGQQLTLTCAEKPMFLSCGDIYKHLGKMLDGCRP